MPDPFAKDAFRCLGCKKKLRPGERFCSQCGRIADGIDTAPTNLVKPASEATDAAVDWRWLELKQVGWLFAILLASSLVGSLVHRVDSSPWPETIESAVDGLVVLLFASLRFPQIAGLLAWPRIDFPAARVLIAVALAFIVIMSVYFRLIERAGVPILRIANTYEKAGWPLLSMLFMVCVVPAVLEEVAFRGVIQSALERILSRREAWVIQAALFSVLHLLPLMFVSHFFMGLCFGYLRSRSKSLYPGMVLHASWNALVLLQELHYL